MKLAVKNPPLRAVAHTFVDVGCSVGELSDNTVYPSITNYEAPFRPHTELGRRLWEIRQRIVAAGHAKMSWDDVEREVAERRGEASA